VKKKHHQEETAATLRSLDGAGRAGAGEFFFTRLQARLQQKGSSAWERVTGWIARPSIAIIGLCIILLLNSIIVIRQFESPVSGTDQATLQAFADEYKLQVPTVYDDDKVE